MDKQDPSLRTLLIEDSDDDAVLIVRELRKAGFMVDYRRVDTPGALKDALDQSDWDIVITDHNMPEFDSAAAIQQINAYGHDLPIIVVSGSIGEDVAVSAMKSGAHDYIMKDNLTRLAPAVERELREAKNRLAHRNAQATIEHMAFHDPLTGLCNRSDFEVRLKHALNNIYAPNQHALFYLDLDQFKIVNDTCGHVAGDELLKQIALLLKRLIRDRDTLARLGGDEFGVLLENCSLAHAQEIASRMLQLIKEFRFVWQDKIFTIGASIGLVQINSTEQSHTELLRAADMACYAAKDQGRNRVHIYAADDAMLMQRHGEMEWVARITRALEDNQFTLHQQRIAALQADANGPACEFLIRLKTPDGKLILPGAFIPAAERYNLMPQIDRWVIERAFGYLAQRQASKTLAPDAIHFINISGATLSDEVFFQFVKESFSKQGIAPQAICFEITETAAIANLSSALAFIQEVRALGCKVALDDFGSGLSSFSYLKTLSADYLKIDGAFVRDMLDDPMDAAIVQAVNSIGHVAGLKTIAEFVEHPEIQTKLTEIGVDFAQGYAIHKPQSIED